MALIFVVLSVRFLDLPLAAWIAEYLMAYAPYVKTTDIPDLLLVNNGSLGDFRPIVLPTVDGTVRDDDVYPIDYDRDGRSEFLVLHGHSPHAAPIQLIALR